MWYASVLNNRPNFASSTLAPIVKNRHYNFPPIGFSQAVGTTARPNEITFSEDRLRPDYRPAPQAAPPVDTHTETGPLSAEVPTAPGAPSATATDPNDGLEGLLVPAGAGS